MACVLYYTIPGPPPNLPMMLSYTRHGKAGHGSFSSGEKLVKVGELRSMSGIRSTERSIDEGMINYVFS